MRANMCMQHMACMHVCAAPFSTSIHKNISASAHLHKSAQRSVLHTHTIPSQFAIHASACTSGTSGSLYLSQAHTYDTTSTAGPQPLQLRDERASGRNLGSFPACTSPGWHLTDAVGTLRSYPYTTRNKKLKKKTRTNRPLTIA